MEIEQNTPKIKVCIRKRPNNRAENANASKDIVEVKQPTELFVREVK